MTMLVGMGRALGIIASERRGNVLQRELAGAVDNEMPDATLTDERPTIAKAFDNTSKLLELMTRRKQRLEDTIATAQEELRQVAVVISGAMLMQDTIERGMRVNAAPEFRPFNPEQQVSPRDD